MDVSENLLIEKIKELKPRFVGLSALIIPVLMVMKKMVERLEKEGLRDDLVLLIGGGITTPQSMDFVGADYQTIDAMEGLKFCTQMSWKMKHYKNTNSGSESLDI